MKINYSKTSIKFINNQDENTKKRIKEGIEGLLEKPPKGDIKPLVKYKDGRFRLRIGKIRIIYRYDVENSLKILYIIDIDYRGDIYK